jgi:hypothetical protein
MIKFRLKKSLAWLIIDFAVSLIGVGIGVGVGGMG